jgi:hypothetical protein
MKKSKVNKSVSRPIAKSNLEGYKLEHKKREPGLDVEQDPEVRKKWLKKQNFVDRLETSYKSKNEREKDYQMYERRDGTKVDRDLSTDQHQVYVSPNDKVHVYHRGSYTATDWLRSDLSLGVGLESMDPRFQNAMKLHNTLKEKYKGKEIVHAGHSLGGALSEYVADRDNSTSSVTYNPGNSILGPSLISRMQQKQNHNVIRTGKDAVSASSLLQRYKNPIQTLDSKAGIVDAHNMTHLKRLNFDVPDSLT